LKNVRTIHVVFLLLVASAIGKAQATPSQNCWTATKHNLSHTLVTGAHGWRDTPAGIIAKRNLKWELPIAAATAILIGAVDVPASRHVKSTSVASATNTASNVLLGSEIGASGLIYAVGCAGHKPALRDNGFTALAGMGYAIGNDLILKVAFNRQYPYTNSGNGEFWAGGKSFPSGHASASFGFASAVAARYPHRRAVKWTAFAVASATSMLRFPAHKHFPSDILVGATLGYVAGSYMARH
jgi:membrane-associated phospholipid phosphatase